MTPIEKSLERVWGTSALAYCTTCGTPVSGVQFACGHDHAAAWSDLSAAEKTQVRRLAIRNHIAARHVSRPAATVAS